MRRIGLISPLLLFQTVLGVAIGRDARDLLSDDSPPTLPVPTRVLPWNDVNFISTSDTHGKLPQTSLS